MGKTRIHISSLSGIRRTIANLCNAKENGGNEDKYINKGAELKKYNAAVKTIKDDTFVFNGKTYNNSGSIVENEESLFNQESTSTESDQLFAMPSFEIPPLTTFSMPRPSFSMQTYPTTIGSGSKFSNAYDDKIIQYANKYGIEPNMVKAIISVESNFNPKAHSSTNDYGLMQLNAKYYGVVYDIDENLDKGCKNFANSLKAFNGDKEKALIGYNMGVAGAKRSGYTSTNYSKKVMSRYNELNQNSNFSINA